MKKLIVSIIAMSFAASVFASCPVWKPYGCTETYSGKMRCGCGV